VLCTFSLSAGAAAAAAVVLGAQRVTALCAQCCTAFPCLTKASAAAAAAAAAAACICFAHTLKADRLLSPTESQTTLWAEM
jgi:hypothetical protein